MGRRPEERPHASASRDDHGSTADADAVRRMRDGDETAFLSLLHRHQGPMLRLARLHVASDATAEDVVQETWIAVLRGIDRFDGRSSLKTWMYRILTNRAKTTGQRERRTTTDADAVQREVDRAVPAVPADRFLDPHDSAWPGHWRQPPLDWERDLQPCGTSSLTEVVGAAIERLPPVQRVVITLRDVECLSAKDVCEVLDLTDSNQRVLLHRARSKVREQLEVHFQERSLEGTR
jgi:RNA polymerase sigma-70 factor (ECF subfamily)